MAVETNPSVWPELRCGDAKALIKFLTEAFGFEETLVVEDAGIVHHAELRWPGCGGVMLGDERAHAGDALHDQLPSGPTSICVVCDDPDAIFQRAAANGADVLQGVTDKEYGSRDFLVRDPEGNPWIFGTYRGAWRPHTRRPSLAINRAPERQLWRSWPPGGECHQSSRLSARRTCASRCATDSW